MALAEHIDEMLDAAGDDCAEPDLIASELDPAGWFRELLRHAMMQAALHPGYDVTMSQSSDSRWAYRIAHDAGNASLRVLDTEPVSIPSPRTPDEVEVTSSLAALLWGDV